MKRTHSLRAALLLSSAVAMLAGCVVEPDQRHYADGVVLVAPPAPQAELIGTPPQPGYVWIGGYWNWVGGRHVWVSGHWDPPRPGYHWVAHVWVRQGDGWRLRPGHWQRG
ncbi:MAG TPA: YXWGXW repeat-containing protein [Steroidobacteraceae bacterium]|nr:YXWGXW repeat-containing protein [Steroidobacteraceae bacterium]